MKAIQYRRSISNLIILCAFIVALAGCSFGNGKIYIDSSPKGAKVYRVNAKKTQSEYICETPCHDSAVDWHYTTVCWEDGVCQTRLTGNNWLWNDNRQVHFEKVSQVRRRPTKAIIQSQKRSKKQDQRWIIPFSSSGSFLVDQISSEAGRIVAKQTSVRGRATDAAGGGLLGFAVGFVAEVAVEEVVESSVRGSLLDMGAGEYFGTFDGLVAKVIKDYGQGRNLSREIRWMRDNMKELLK